MRARGAAGEGRGAHHIGVIEVQQGINLLRQAPGSTQPHGSMQAAGMGSSRQRCSCSGQLAQAFAVDRALLGAPWRAPTPAAHRLLNMRRRTPRLACLPIPLPDHRHCVAPCHSSAAA